MKLVPGYSDLLAMEDGRIFSISKDMWLVPRLLKTKWGSYHRVAVRGSNGRPTRQSVHQLVCRAYHGLPPSPDHGVNHLDGIKTHNAEYNLEWATPADNNAHAVLFGLNKFDRGTACKYKDYVTGQMVTFDHVSGAVAAGHLSKPRALISYNKCQLINGRILVPIDKELPEFTKDQVDKSVSQYVARNGFSIDVMNYLTGQEETYEGYTDFLNRVHSTGISKNNINMRVSTGRVWPIRGFAFKYTHNPTPFPILDRFQIEFSFDATYHWGVTKEFVLTDSSTGKSKRFGGLRRVAEHMDVPLSTVRYYLEEKGGLYKQWEVKPYQPS